VCTTLWRDPRESLKLRHETYRKVLSCKPFKPQRTPFELGGAMHGNTTRSCSFCSLPALAANRKATTPRAGMGLFYAHNPRDPLLNFCEFRSRVT